jgi:hypothetical protein
VADGAGGGRGAHGSKKGREQREVFCARADVFASQ